jgi:hypothetical protein
MVLVFIGDLWAFRGTSLPFVIDFLFTDLAGTAGYRMNSGLKLKILLCFSLVFYFHLSYNVPNLLVQVFPTFQQNKLMAL